MWRPCAARRPATQERLRRRSGHAGATQELRPEVPSTVERDLAERRSHPGNALLKDLALAPVGAATSQHPRLRLACSPVPP